MRPFGSPEQLEWRRRRAIEMLEQGAAPVEVATALDVDRRSVRRWKAAVRRHGAAAIQARLAPGRPPKLSARQKSGLERLLLKGAQAAGFPSDLWTCSRVAQLIRSRFAIDYHEDHVGRLLHAWGWSPQRPQRRAAERDQTLIGQWVKVQWPAIKKKPSA